MESNLEVESPPTRTDRGDHYNDIIESNDDILPPINGGGRRMRNGGSLNQNKRPLSSSDSDNSESDKQPEQKESEAFNESPPKKNARKSIAEDDSALSPSSAAKGDMNQLPRATVTKLINELLPPGIVCPKETRELILQCCTEFIHLVTGEANDICEQRHKKTISPEHISEALRLLGFGDYCEEAEAASTVFETQQKQKKQGRDKSRDLQERSGLTEIELQRQQQELFEAARQRYLNVNQKHNGSGDDENNSNVGDENEAKDRPKGEENLNDDHDSEEDDEDLEILSGTKPLDD